MEKPEVGNTGGRLNQDNHESAGGYEAEGPSPPAATGEVVVYHWNRNSGALFSVADTEGKYLFSARTDESGKAVIRDMPEDGSITFYDFTEGILVRMLSTLQVSIGDDIGNGWEYREEDSTPLTWIHKTLPTDLVGSPVYQFSSCGDRHSGLTETFPFQFVRTARVDDCGYGGYYPWVAYLFPEEGPMDQPIAFAVGTGKDLSPSLEKAEVASEVVEWRQDFGKSVLSYRHDHEEDARVHLQLTAISPLVHSVDVRKDLISSLNEVTTASLLVVPDVHDYLFESIVVGRRQVTFTTSGFPDGTMTSSWEAAHSELLPEPSLAVKDQGNRLVITTGKQGVCFYKLAPELQTIAISAHLPATSTEVQWRIIHSLDGTPVVTPELDPEVSATFSLSQWTEMTVTLSVTAQEGTTYSDAKDHDLAGNEAALVPLSRPVFTCNSFSETLSLRP